MPDENIIKILSAAENRLNAQNTNHTYYACHLYRLVGGTMIEFRCSRPGCQSIISKPWARVRLAHAEAQQTGETE